jgi:hypothetical protein
MRQQIALAWARTRIAAGNNADAATGDKQVFAPAYLTSESEIDAANSGGRHMQ